LAMAAANPDRYLVVDGTVDPEAIHAEVILRCRHDGLIA